MKASFTLALLAVVVGSATACCISYGDIAMTLSREKAIIIWDQEAKVEHFIRSASFTGGAKDFGFILPTPSQPTAIEVADAEAFGLLESFKPMPPNSDTAAAGGVEILEQKKVGDYEVTVLKAAEGSAIGDWLKKNGHKMRPAMEPWLDYYAKKGWILTAFRYQNATGKSTTKAVRVSFPTEKPHYPYKMPSDTWSEGHARPLTLFVVSQTAVRGKYEDDKVWETDEKWRAKISTYHQPKLEKMLGVPGSPLALPAGMTVTRFENSELANNYDHDLIFESNNPPYWALWLGLGGMGWAAFTFYRRSKLPQEDR